ncbi:hypothetical protein AB2T90_11030 [Clostridium butyricum]
MNKVLNDIMKEFKCNSKEAEVILNNVLNNSNIVRTAIINKAKKEYEV